jgi:putative transposase
VSDDDMLSIVRQCDLLDLNRSSLYYSPATESELNLKLMPLIDEEFTRHPFFGSRRLAWWLGRQGHQVNRKRVQRLMRLMGLEAIHPKPHLSLSNEQHKKYPYLLSGVQVVRPNQVWATDITYIRLRAGFLYLVAIMDWFSRYVLSWRLSNTLETSFCLEALEEALIHGPAEIFNSDQGCQFTSHDFTREVEAAGMQMSMDGKGRVFDNIFVERLWRSLKYEEVYLKDYDDVPEAIDGIRCYWRFYNTERPHQSLGNLTPAEVYFGNTAGGETTLN